MPAYYNDNDAYCCQWLRNLIAAGHLPAGDVDERPIQEVNADDLEGYDACHFFAGIGGWPYALRLAGWSGPVWTGSCPCPPFSQAGRKLTCPSCESPDLVWCPRRTGYCICARCAHAWLADERHLWPELWRLIRDGRPAVIFGEQVASADGRDWLAGVRGSLEILGYDPGGADLCAAGVGAPHIRQRLFWVADTEAPGRRRRGRAGQAGGGSRAVERPDGLRDAHPSYCDWFSVCHDPNRCDGQRCLYPDGGPPGWRWSDDDGWMADGLGAGLEGRQVEPARQKRATAERSGGTGRVGGADGARSQPGEPAAEAARHRDTVAADGGGVWDAFDLIPCADGKARRAEPGIHPLAHGVSGRVGRLRAYGNAIVPQVGAAFVAAFMEQLDESS